ncbi:uncharacterized protein LOC131882593 isoform X2 [Tigriopus californicus]|uniref:uncharacterized protein LOC131882593 isoform X2 n=1 Tax=Tigriopus californicus TaxID=6832 RepID=UPI0027D9E127|nr:uncharacterized protein LOC131882593 isoform X2 [Tigriopus californicus]
MMGPMNPTTRPRTRQGLIPPLEVSQWKGEEQARGTKMSMFRLNGTRPGLTPNLMDIPRDRKILSITFMSENLVSTHFPTSGLGGQPPDIPTMPLDLDTYGTSTSADVFLYESGENEGTQPRRSHSSLSNYKYEDQSQFIRNLGLTNPGEDEDDENEQVIPTFNQQELGDGVSFGEMEMDRQQGLNPGPSSAQIVPRRHQFRPRDTIVLGGTQEMTPSNEIHHQSYTYQRQARQRGPQGLLALEGDMELNRVNNINQLTHQTFAREGIAKPSDHLKLEGDFQRKSTQDDQQRFKYTRTARAQGPQGQIQLDKSLAHAKHSSKNDLVAFTQSARPKRVQGYRDNLSLGDGKQDFGNRKRDNHVANSTGVKPERVRTSMHRDNMKVGEGKLETESSNRLEYRHINLHQVDELRAKPSWYQQPRTSMTITGEVSHG